ncbi:sodium/pantothenate symporter [Chryseomicrobium sp. FSL W7-1435]|uniref:sodium/pantothenate symporter n=1 Tax=Chryseomicrobium sp. FSL W7-1435 TaxID=2921704 RepID=UPI00315A505F
MNWGVLLPLVIFLIAIFATGWIASRQKAGSSNFLNDYFLGGRELGGFVLAMTMVATYGSASSFLGGPGTAYSMGFGWVLLAMTQVVTGYFVLLILGKKFAILSRRYKAITLIDFLKARYNSPFVAILSAIAIVIFLFSAMTAQWVGGARLIETVTGLSYTSALFIFVVSVLIYVTTGGFRAVALTDAVQGSIMVIGTTILLIAVIIAGGGIPNIMQDLLSENPNLVTPYGSEGNLTAAYVSSFWILVGVGVVGLPQIAVRAMSYKTSRGMHRALVIGTIVTGFIMLNMHLIGVFARAVMPGIEVPDTVIPVIALEVLPPWLAGIVLAAPLAAIMSTVDSLLLLVSSSVVKDVYLSYIQPNASMKTVKRLSFGVTAVLGSIVFVLAVDPPELLIFLNLFAFGGLEAAFIWPIVLGLYWKYGNKYGAIASMLTGIIGYIALHFYNTANGNLFGIHTVVVPVVLSFIAYIVFSLLIKRQVYRY